MNAQPFLLMNDTLLPADAPCIPAQDRGWKYGDAVFETLGVRAGVPYGWQAHMARLHCGLQALGFQAMDASLLKQRADTLLQANHCTDGVLRITISRGDGGHGYAPPANATPRALMQTLPLPLREPLRLWCAHSVRKPAPAHFPSNHKTANALVSVLAMQEAAAQACNDALLLATDGTLCSTASACLFWQDAHGHWHTPPLACGALDGIARGWLMQSMDVQETTATPQDLQHATAVVAINSVRLAQPVQSLAPQGMAWESIAAAEALNATLEARIDAALNAERDQWIVR